MTVEVSERSLPSGRRRLRRSLGLVDIVAREDPKLKLREGHELATRRWGRKRGYEMAHACAGEE